MLPVLVAARCVESILHNRARTASASAALGRASPESSCVVTAEQKLGSFLRHASPPPAPFLQACKRHARLFFCRQYFMGSPITVPSLTASHASVIHGTRKVPAIVLHLLHRLIGPPWGRSQWDGLRTSSVSRAVCIGGRVPFAGRPLQLGQLSQLFLLCAEQRLCVNSSSARTFCNFVPVHDSLRSFKLFISPSLSCMG